MPGSTRTWAWSWAIRDIRSLFPERTDQMQAGSTAQKAHLQLEALTTAITNLSFPYSGEEGGKMGSRADLSAALEFVKNQFKKDAQGNRTIPTRDTARQVRLLRSRPA